jgi:hypothetical protein
MSPRSLQWDAVKKTNDGQNPHEVRNNAVEKAYASHFEGKQDRISQAEVKDSAKTYGDAAQKMKNFKSGSNGGGKTPPGSGDNQQIVQ